MVDSPIFATRFLPPSLVARPAGRHAPSRRVPSPACAHQAPCALATTCEMHAVGGNLGTDFCKGHTEQATSTAALLGRGARAQPRARPRPSLGCRAAASRGRVAHHLRGTQHATKPTKEAAHTPTATQPHPRAAAWATPSAHNCSSAAPPPARSHATNPECLRCSTNARVASVTRHGPTWPSVAHNLAIEPGSAWRATDEVCGWGDGFASTCVARTMAEAFGNSGALSSCKTSAAAAFRSSRCCRALALLAAATSTRSSIPASTTSTAHTNGHRHMSACSSSGPPSATRDNVGARLPQGPLTS